MATTTERTGTAFLSFGTKEAQSKFLGLPSEIRDSIIDKQHSEALAVNRLVNSVCEDYMVVTDPDHLWEVLAEGNWHLRTEIASKRIKIKEDLARFEAENPEYSYLIDQAQEVLSSIGSNRLNGFNLRDYLTLVKSKQEYVELTKKRYAWGSTFSRGAVVNAFEDGQSEETVYFSTSPEQEYPNVQRITLVHEGLHLLSQHPLEETPEGHLERSGFRIIVRDEHFHLVEEQNHWLDELVVEFFTANLLKKSVYGKFLDWEKILHGKAYNILIAGRILEEAAGGEEAFLDFYLRGDFEGFRDAVKKASRKHKDEHSQLLRKLFNNLSDEKI